MEGIGVRDGGGGVRTPQFGQIGLPETHFGWGNKGDVYRVLVYDRQK